MGAEDYVDADRVIASFLESQKADVTRRSYERDISGLKKSCDARGIPLLKAAAIDLTRYFDELAARPLANSTLNRYKSTAFSFYQFAIANGLLLSNPMSGIKREPKNREPVKSPLTRDDLAVVVSLAIDTLPPDKCAAVLLIAINGLKVSEVSAADVSHLSRSGEFWRLKIPSRDADEAAILPPIVAEPVLSCAGNRRKGPLLGEVFDRFRIGRITQSLGKKAGLAWPLTPSMLRNTMIGVALSAGCNIATLARALGVDDPRAFTAHLEPETAPNLHPAIRVANALTTSPASDDLLYQVAQLLQDPSIHPVAPIVLGAAVLEARLRSLVQRNGLTISGKPALGTYTQALRAAKVISNIEWRELEVMNEMRIQAAHGIDLDRLTHSMAKKMYMGVKEFLQNHS